MSITHDLNKLAPIGPLTDWLDAYVPQLGKGPLKTEVLSGGTSNVVLTLNRGEQEMCCAARPPCHRPEPRRACCVRHGC
jgi:aminoglycoside phosphotransferase (APT) family kinase protein